MSIMETMERKQPRVRRSFTPEFKAEIVELCQRGDRSIGQVARDFDLTETAVREWVRQVERDSGNRSDGGLTSAERHELAALRRENQRLRGDVSVTKKAVAHSRGRCNSRGEPSSRRLVPEGLARPGVQPSSDRVQVGLAVDGEVCLPREVLTEQSVGVLVRAALPGASRVTEVHRDVGGDGEAAVVGELHAPVPGEARLELRG